MKKFDNKRTINISDRTNRLSLDGLIAAIRNINDYVAAMRTKQEERTRLSPEKSPQSVADQGFFHHKRQLPELKFSDSSPTPRYPTRFKSLVLGIENYH